MPKKAKFGFGNSSGVEQAIQDGKLNQRDILFLDEDTDNPKVGWIDLNGDVVIATPDLSEVKADISSLETELANKVSAEDVDAKIGEIEATLNDAAKAKYEITDVPDGTLIKMNENEIRIMCPADAKYHLQSVGAGGDANTYYITLKTYIYDDNVVGYIEHLGDLVDTEILTDLKTDEYGRRFQPSWLGVAKYDESTDSWTYYGASSSENRYIGWDYQLDLYDVNGVMIASDSVRINLSNENCHYAIEPYYVGSMMAEVDTKIEKKLAEVNTGYEIVEF